MRISVSSVPEGKARGLGFDECMIKRNKLKRVQA